MYKVLLARGLLDIELDLRHGCDKPWHLATTICDDLWFSGRGQGGPAGKRATEGKLSIENQTWKEIRDGWRLWSRRFLRWHHKDRDGARLRGGVGRPPRFPRLPSCHSSRVPAILFIRGVTKHPRAAQSTTGHGSCDKL